MVPLHVHTMLVVESMNLGRWPLRPIRRALLMWAITRYHEHVAMQTMMARAFDEADAHEGRMN